MAAVVAQQKIHDAFMTGPENLIEFFHGYTYSAHPLACAAAIATLDTYAEEGLLTRAAEMAAYFAQGVHSLKGEPNVIDIRNIGLVGGIELQAIEGVPGLLGTGPDGAQHGRHHCAFAAADRATCAHRPDGGNAARRHPPSCVSVV